MVKNKYVLFLSLAAILSFATYTFAATVTQSNSGTSSGGGTGTSASYSNSNSIAFMAGNSSSFNYRNYVGFAPANFAPPLNTVAFSDSSPDSSVPQNNTNVTAKITIQTLTGNTVSTTTIQYKISNNGMTIFGPANSAGIVLNIVSSITVICSLDIPTSAGDTLSKSEDNYIMWYALNDLGAGGWSDPYRIRVQTNSGPEIAINQPSKKSGYTSVQPVINATITAPLWGINAATIKVEIQNKSGSIFDSFFINTLGNNVYNTQTGLLNFKYLNKTLSNNAEYKLIISATDLDGVTKLAEVDFTAKGGAIADLIPYPSPFDPANGPIMIRYVLDKRSDVSINIYDMSGRLVKTVVDNLAREAGISEDPWSGANFASEELANGVYFCEIVAKDEDGEHRRYTSLAIFGK